LLPVSAVSLRECSCGSTLDRVPDQVENQKSTLSNQRLQLALPPIGVRLWAVLPSWLVMDGKIVLTSFVQLTPTLRWGAAETHNR
jgi:hypothetical protein